VIVAIAPLTDEQSQALDALVAVHPSACRIGEATQVTHPGTWRVDGEGTIDSAVVAGLVAIGLAERGNRTRGGGVALHPDGGMLAPTSAGIFAYAYEARRRVGADGA